MKLLPLLLLSLSALLGASTEKRYEPEFEKRCFKEVAALKCGSPEGKNNPTFMKCVDGKITKLSKGCQEMHRELSSEAHDHH